MNGVEVLRCPATGTYCEMGTFCLAEKLMQAMDLANAGEVTECSNESVPAELREDIKDLFCSLQKVRAAAQFADNDENDFAARHSAVIYASNLMQNKERFGRDPNQPAEIKVDIDPEELELEDKQLEAARVFVSGIPALNSLPTVHRDKAIDEIARLYPKVKIALKNARLLDAYVAGCNFTLAEGNMSAVVHGVVTAHCVDISEIMWIPREKADEILKPYM